MMLRHMCCSRHFLWQDRVYKSVYFCKLHLACLRIRITFFPNLC